MCVSILEYHTREHIYILILLLFSTKQKSVEYVRLLSCCFFGYFWKRTISAKPEIITSLEQISIYRNKTIMHTHLVVVSVWVELAGVITDLSHNIWKTLESKCEIHPTYTVLRTTGSESECCVFILRIRQKNCHSVTLRRFVIYVPAIVVAGVHPQLPIRRRCILVLKWSGHLFIVTRPAILSQFVTACYSSVSIGTISD